MIKKLLLWIAIGLILFFVFLYLEGGRIITGFSTKAQKIGNELERSEQEVKKFQRKVSKDAEKRYEKLKDWFDKTYDSSLND
jgi:ATP-dependent protease HslVU (ClpYQ) peptidase subunit